MYSRVALSGPLVILFLFAPLSESALTQRQTSSQTPVPDAQAIAVLQQAIVAMGSTPPSDSTAAGTVSTVSGSQIEQGTIRILTRGTDQTLEQIQTPHGATTVYSRDEASSLVGSTVSPLSIESALSSQCPDFPLPLLAGAINNSDIGYKYIGPETLNGAAVYHIQFWNSYSSNPSMKPLSDFTTKDIWIDSTSYLPARLSYVHRVAQGSSPRIPVDVFYSNYQNVSGILYPFSVHRSFNGTPWATITIQSVTLNGGLTDSDFPVQ